MLHCAFRMCVDYIWHDERDGFRSIWIRIAKASEFYCQSFFVRSTPDLGRCCRYYWWCVGVPINTLASYTSSCFMFSTSSLSLLLLRSHQIAVYKPQIERCTRACWQCCCSRDLTVIASRTLRTIIIARCSSVQYSGRHIITTAFCEHGNELLQFRSWFFGQRVPRGFQWDWIAAIYQHFSTSCRNCRRIIWRMFVRNL